MDRPASLEVTRAPATRSKRVQAAVKMAKRWREGLKNCVIGSLRHSTKKENTRSLGSTKSVAPRDNNCATNNIAGKAGEESREGFFGATKKVGPPEETPEK